MLVVTGMGLRSGTSAMMNILVNDLGFELVGEQYPAELPTCGNPDGYFEATDSDAVVQAFVDYEPGEKKVVKLWAPMLEQLMRAGANPDAVEQIVLMIRNDRDAQEKSMITQWGREEAWREAQSFAPLHALDIAGAEEQFVAWPRQLGLAAQYFNVASPLAIGMENLLHQPVETLFDLKAHLQGTYPDISPYEEEQELLESMLSVVPDVKAETYTGTVLDTLDTPVEVLR